MVGLEDAPAVLFAQQPVETGIVDGRRGRGTDERPGIDDQAYVRGRRVRLEGSEIAGKLEA